MTYGVVAIVKDESERIGEMLTSAQRAGATVATILDTGSDDDTIERITRLGLPDLLVHLAERPWVNFGHNRSEALALARGTATWLLALDADMTVEIDPDFVPDPSVDAYMLKMGTDDFAYRLPLLLRGDLPWRSFGAVHEYTAMEDGSLGVRRATDQVRVTTGSSRSSPEKTRWQLSLLEADYEKDPSNPRTVFYMAQSHRELGDIAKARWYYGMRMNMAGFEEETFYAAYRFALLGATPQQRIIELLSAWERRPARLEPLVAAMREMNAQNLHAAAYALSAFVPPACHDQLFVHRDAWRWGMKFERSIAAWWLGYKAESAVLMDELLHMDLPDDIRAAVERNRAFAA